MLKLSSESSINPRYLVRWTKRKQLLPIKAPLNTLDSEIVLGLNKLISVLSRFDSF